MTRPSLNRIWAGGPLGAVTPITPDKYAKGWEAEIPTYQNLNYLHNRWDKTLMALAQRGFFEWGEDISYIIGSLAWYEPDGVVYVALVDDPKGVPAGSASWAKSMVQIPETEFRLLGSAIDEHIANKGNPHGTTAAQLSAYTIAQVDALIAQLRAALDAHMLDKLNPHGTTALLAGAVPVTGGTYVGPVTHTNPLTIGDVGKIRVVNGGVAIGTEARFLEAATDKPYWNNVAEGTRQRLLVEDELLQRRKDTEKLFAVPTPLLYCPFASDVHMYEGFGRGNAVLKQRTFTNILGESVLSSPTVMPITWDGLQFYAKDKYTLPAVLASPEWTVSFKTKHTPATTMFLWFDVNTFIHTNVHGVYIEFNKVNTQVARPVAENTQYKVVIVATQTTFRVCVNDVQTGEVPRVGMPSPKLPMVLTGDNVGYIKDLKVFSQALTYEQTVRL